MSDSFSIPIDVRFADIDAYGHVNSAVYFTYMEIARVKLFNDFFNESQNRGLFIVVGRSECSFKIPIMLNDGVVISVTTTKIGKTSFELEYRLHDNNDRLYAVGSTTMVCFDNIKKSPVEVPDRLKELLQRRLMP